MSLNSTLSLIKNDNTTIHGTWSIIRRDNSSIHDTLAIVRNQNAAIQKIHSDSLTAVRNANLTLQMKITALENKVAFINTLLVHFSRTGNEVYITGANLNIRNGSGRTDTVNGLGNLIVGYNEAESGSTKNGSQYRKWIAE